MHRGHEWVSGPRRSRDHYSGFGPSGTEAQFSGPNRTFSASLCRIRRARGLASGPRLQFYVRSNLRSALPRKMVNNREVHDLRLAIMPVPSTDPGAYGHCLRSVTSPEVLKSKIVRKSISVPRVFAEPTMLATKKSRGRKLRNVSTGKGLTRRTAGGRAANAESSQRAAQLERITERRRKVWELYIARHTFEEIAAQVGISNAQAWRDCMAVRDQIMERGLLDSVHRLERQVAGLDSLHATHFPKREKKASADILLRVYDAERKLFGLNAPKKIAETNSRPYRDLSDTELDKRIEELSVIDIEPQSRPEA